MTRILVECYDILYTYLMGDSRKNELYIAKHIEFFESQISFEVSFVLIVVSDKIPRYLGKYGFIEKHSAVSF